ncbi:hypothetical protein BCR39DRAFT_530255 [Naematelia encephala]|uniref:Uncharacterized protein n=1 Tax=Naematelia encephala TaxID=71784 RepID=A0A1Y2B548_9TREE|nr:hypothetical protein BCR39DRAFT_530255 [Naematelia encephala]
MSAAASGSKSSKDTETDSPRRRPSQNRRSSSADNILRSVDEPPPTLITTLIKHGKYIALGGVGTWYTDLIGVGRRILDEESGWIRRVLVAAIGLHGLTIIIFLYLVLFLPWFRGYIPHYPKWQQSARLRLLVPVLTATILLGWTSYVVSLSQAGKASIFVSLGDAVQGVGEADPAKMSGTRGIGVFRAMAGTTALYALTLGVLGLIPAPSNVPIRKKHS